MTIEQAKQWLALQNNDWNPNEDPLEAIDEVLFVQKNFFLSKAPIAKLFEAKIKILIQLEEVCAVFSVKRDINLKQAVFEGQLEILDNYNAYQQTRNKVKQLLLASEHPQEVSHYAKLLLQIQKEYASLWFVENQDLTAVIVSQEPDPMQLLEAIKNYKINGGNTFAHLKSLQNNPPEILLNEQKRLSLLFQKY